MICAQAQVLLLQNKWYKIISFVIWKISVAFPENIFTDIHLKQQEIFLDIIFSLEVFLKGFKNWQVNSECLNKKAPCVEQLDFHPLDFAKSYHCVSPLGQPRRILYWTKVECIMEAKSGKRNWFQWFWTDPWMGLTEWQKTGLRVSSCTVLHTKMEMAFQTFLLELSSAVCAKMIGKGVIYVINVTWHLGFDTCGMHHMKHVTSYDTWSKNNYIIIHGKYRVIHRQHVINMKHYY